MTAGASSTDAFVTPSGPGQPWGGLHWVRLAPNDPLAFVTAVRAWSGGYVAIGWDPGGGRSTPVWSSSDGATWRPIAFNTARTFWPGMMILGVAAVPGGVVAIGRTGADCGGTCPTTYSGPVVSWTSHDGLAWSPHVIPETWLTLSPSTPGAPVLASGSAGLIVTTVDRGPRFATSTDGVRWHRIAGVPLPPAFALADLAATVGGFVAVGRLDGSTGTVAATAASAGGLRWSEPAPLPGGTGTGRASSADTLIVGSQGVIAVGGILATPGATLWWRSRDGRHWSGLPTYAPLGASDCVGEGCGLQPAGGLVSDGSRIVAVRFGWVTSAWTTIDAASWSPLQMFGDLPDPDARPVALLPSGVLATKGGTSWLGVAVPR